MSVLVAVAALFIVVFPVASAVATPPEGVTLEGDAFFDGLEAGTGVFAASGPAFVTGAMCPGATTADVPGTVVTGGGQSPNGITLRVVKEFTCGDGSGSFFVKLRARIHNSGSTTFKWVIEGGTGAYASLKGNGTGSGTPLSGDPNGVYDTYNGKVH